MPKKETIFEETWYDNLYLKLESEENVAPLALGIQRISIIETMQLGSPFLNLKLMDGYGDFTNIQYISPKAEYQFTLGRSEQYAYTHPFKLSVSNMSNTALGKTENIAMDVTMLSSGWEKNTKDTKCRAWEQMTYSAIVEEIIQEMGISEYDIEPTDGTYDVIQPFWTNFQLIKWLAANSVSSTGKTGYQFGFLSNGKFIFKSLDKIYSQKPKHQWSLGSPENDKLSFGQFTIRHEYQPVLQNGGFGVEYEYYDFETKSWITGQKKYSETDTRQLSDWVYLCEEHETAESNYHGGRHTDTEKFAESIVTDTANSTQSIEIAVSGQPDVHVGEIAELLILSGQFQDDYIVNEKYSGNWMIEKITHDILFNKKQYTMYIKLSRSGFNGVNMKGFVKTSTGKKIG